MIEIFIMLAWGIGLILGIMWLFLPWIIISKLNEVIEELKKLNSSRSLT
ncbi:MAG: hypothetical protein JW994_01300 [Candidatus Omnitrophica bacterium]|nr:hypothetical protein [Candidatus Omnitrophota bacterium]